MRAKNEMKMVILVSINKSIGNINIEMRSMINPFFR